MGAEIGRTALRGSPTLLEVGSTFYTGNFQNEQPDKDVLMVPFIKDDNVFGDKSLFLVNIVFSLNFICHLEYTLSVWY